MTKMLIPVIALVIIAGIAGVLVLNRPQTSETPQMMEKKTDVMVKETPAAMMEKTDDAMMAKAGSYIPYTADAYQSMAEKKRVLFFHASWCPTCKAANEDFTKNTSQLPADVVVFKTDYDNERALKQKYAITSQHTFVQVDAQGNEVTKWNGGAAAELLANLK